MLSHSRYINRCCYFFTYCSFFRLGSSLYFYTTIFENVHVIVLLISRSVSVLETISMLPVVDFLLLSLTCIHFFLGGDVFPADRFERAVAHCVLIHCSLSSRHLLLSPQGNYYTSLPLCKLCFSKCLWATE